MQRIASLAQFPFGRQPIIEVLTVFPSALDIPFVRALRNEIAIDVRDHGVAGILRSSVFLLSDSGHITSRGNSRTTPLGSKNRALCEARLRSLNANNTRLSLMLDRKATHHERPVDRDSHMEVTVVRRRRSTKVTEATEFNRLVFLRVFRF